MLGQKKLRAKRWDSDKWLAKLLVTFFCPSIFCPINLLAPRLLSKGVTAGATIQATGGHAWWTSGKGWTKTRDLEPGSYLHTATGNVLIKELIEEPEPVPTYNLIVDQAHTYFVGPDRVLSHDNSPESVTNLKLPGYVEPS